MRTVENYRDALLNAKSFIIELEKSEMLQKLLSQFRHWYYFEESKSFAPSKYIGYKNNSAEIYERNHQEGSDGRETETALKKFFRKAGEDEIEALYRQLEYILSLYDKKPRKNTIIHLRK